MASPLEHLVIIQRVSAAHFVVKTKITLPKKEETDFFKEKVFKNHIKRKKKKETPPARKYYTAHQNPSTCHFI